MPKAKTPATANSNERRGSDKLDFLNMSQLETFHKTIELGSMTLASTALGLSKSQISRSLMALESAIGTPLLYRTTRKIQLTSVGEQLLARTRPLMDQLREVASDFRVGSDQLTGRIRVAAALDLGKALLPAWIDTFRELHPQVQLEVHLSQSRTDLVSDAIDVALRVGNVEEKSFKIRKLLDIHLLVVCAHNWPLRRTIQADETDAIENCFSFVPLIDRKMIMKQGSKIREIKFRRDLVSNDPDFILHFVRTGQGCALVPDILVQKEIQSGALINLLPNWTSPISPLHMVFPIQQKLPAQLKTFADFLVAQAEEFQRTALYQATTKP